MESKKDMKNEIIELAKDSIYMDIDMKCLTENLSVIKIRSSLREIRDSLVNFNSFPNGDYGEY
jgi:hypothetical protein